MWPIPPERLIVETDGSFLIPRDLKPNLKHRNETKYLPHILNRIAYEQDIDSKILAIKVTKNTKEFFNI